MKSIIKLILLIGFLNTGILYAQQSNITRGVYLFGTTDVNLQQMHDSLYLNTVQASTGYNPAWDNTILHNTQNLKIYSQRSYLATQSSAQRMIYQAEQAVDPNGVKNYFGTKIGQIPLGEDTAWQARVGVNNAGYMVYSCWPNNEYHYGESRGVGYYATFRLKVDQTAGNPQTVKCIVYDSTNHQTLKDTTLYYNDLLPSGSYKNVPLYFTLATQANSPRNYNKNYLTGGAVIESQSLPTTMVDLRVYWYGSVTTYLDNITVEDTLAHSLFAGTNDAAIKQEAGQFTQAGYPLHDKFYLVDEPPVSAFLGYNYVGNRIKDTIVDASRSGTVSAMYHEFQRFLIDGVPYQLMTDPYFITSDIPHPSITDNDIADSAGIAHWNYSTYTTQLQYHLDGALTGNIRPASEAAKNQSKSWILIPQLHGAVFFLFHKYWDQNGANTLRPPSPTEIRLSYNVGIAYGAKGFLPYPYGTDYWWADYPTNQYPVAFDGLVTGRTYNGYLMDHWNNIDTIYGRNIWTGYKEKWNEVAALNRRLMQVGDSILALNWVGAKSWSNSSGQTTDWSGIVSGITTKDTLGNQDAQSYVEVGHLQRGTTNYIVVVNRRCASNSINNDRRDISVTLASLSFANVLVTNIETNTAFVVPNAGTFTDRFNPGEGKIYRLENANIANTRTFSNLTVGSGATLTIASGGSVQLTNGAGITNNGAINVSGTLQVNYNLTISGSGTVTIGTGGQVLTAASTTLTTASGIALVAQAGSTFRFGSNGYLTVNGSLNASGNINTGILFTSTSATPGLGLWNRIGLYGGPNILSYCTVKYSNFGIYVYNTSSNSVQYCSIDSSQNFGVYLGNTAPDSTTCAIFQTTITHCNTGISLSNANVGVSQSTIQNNRGSAISLLNSRLHLALNTIQNNAGKGVYQSGTTSNTYFGDNQLNPGCNILTSNFYEVYLNAGYATIGFYNPPSGPVYYAPNYIYDGSTFSGHLVKNLSGNSITARRCWWGNGTANNFLGSIDTQYAYYTRPNCPIQGKTSVKNNTNIAFGGLDDAMVENIFQWKKDIQSNGSNAVAALYHLACYANAKQSYTDALGTPWETYLQQVGATTSLAKLKSIVTAHLIQAKINHQNYADALTMIDEVLSQNPGDDLWMYCQEEKICLYLKLQDMAGAEKTYKEMIERVQKFDPELLVVLRSLIDAAVGDNSNTVNLIKQHTVSPLVKPASFALEQNYPNPFNPVTHIQYQLPAESKVTLKIYNILGQLVSTLIDETQSAGHKSVTFNGSSLPSGVYFYHLQAGAYNDVKKLVLTK
jgi:hypothetical protein